MTQKKKNLLEQDSTLRLIYAFNYFTSLNESWEEDSNTTIHNRKISEKVGVNIDDAYFVFENRFYSINYHRVDSNINCEIKEYDNFYDLATSMLVMNFEYSSIDKSISILTDVTKKMIKDNSSYQKRIKVA